VCDNIRSSENIGSIFRTADALRIDKVFLCGICDKPPSSKIAKTALGAEQSVPWEYYAQTWRLIEKLKSENVFVVCLEQTSKSILYTELTPKFPFALVIGNEVRGISSSVIERANAIIELPMHGAKESLNVSVAFGVTGFEINKNRGR